MSKIAIAIAVPSLLASAGLGLLCLDLSAEIDALQDALQDQRTAAPQTAENSTLAPRAASRREDGRVRAMEERLVALESRTPAAAAVTSVEAGPLAAARSDEQLAALADLPAALRSADFERAVRGVLDARDVERRAERMQKAAESRTRQLLRGLEVDEQVRGQVAALVSDSLRRRDELRDADLEHEIAMEQAAELRGELERGLESVLSADQMERVRARLDAQRGGDAGDRRKQPRKIQKRGRREAGGDAG